MQHAPLGATAGQQALRGYTLFRTGDLDEARSRVAGVLSPHELATSRRAQGLDTCMASAQLGAISVNRLRYGATVHIDAGRTQDFALVMMPLCGVADVSCGHQTIRSTTALAAVVSPTQPLRMTSRSDCDQIMVRIDRALLERHCAQHLGHALEHPIEFDVGMNLSGPGGSSWQALVSFLVGELDRASPLLSSPIARSQIEGQVASTLLLAQPHRYRDELLRPARPIAPAYVRRVEAFIETHAEQPLGAGELAAQAGVSLSTLFAGFRQYRNTSPMAFLRQVRLRRVREQLLAAPAHSESVTRIALHWGFTHLGRFAADYRRAFGESPSQTLRR